MKSFVAEVAHPVSRAIRAEPQGLVQGPLGVGGAIRTWSSIGLYATSRQLGVCSRDKPLRLSFAYFFM
jgi:hypothetical protein